MQTSLSLTKPSLMWAVTGSAGLSRPCRRRAQLISAVAAPSKPLKYQTTHSMPMEKIELFRSLEGWATDNLLPMLKPVDQCWQPQKFLPNAASMPKDEFHDRVQDLRDRAAHLSDECILMLLGSMITEDALPTYQSMVNRLDGVKDETGASTSPWATWIRCWTAEENRHGDLLHTYLYLTGRVDMFMVQRTIQYLIGAGMDPGFENNPYLGFVYTSFQERATFISHGNIARMVKEGGDPVLARICGTIAADEKRHENAYLKIVDKLLEVDPNDSVLAIGKMLRKNIEMPAHLMTDPDDPTLFKRLEAMTQHLGIYTLGDYADIVEFLIDRWGLEKIEGLSPEAREAQEFVCRLAPRVRRIQELADYRNKKLPPRKLKFSWLFNKELTMKY